MRRSIALLLALLACGCVGQGGGFSVTSDHVYFDDFSVAFGGMDVLASEERWDGERVVFSDGSALIFINFSGPLSSELLRTYAQNQLDKINEDAPKEITGGTVLGAEPLKEGDFHGYPALIMTESMADADGNEFTFDIYYMFCNNIIVQGTDLNDGFKDAKCAV